MPHKHVRRGQQDPSLFDLPPSTIALPLPVQPNSASPAHARSKKRKKARSADLDDAPRAFKRLMAFANGKKLKSGLDDGSPDMASAPSEPISVSSIRPGEKLADYSSRVDAALPISGLKRKGQDPLGLKVTRTRKEKKMHKLYDQWREEERKIQAEREEELELAAERELEKEAAGKNADFSFLDATQPAKSKRSRGRRRAKVVEDDDPWAEVSRRRAEAKVGLNDCSLAPPTLHRVRSTKLLTAHGASVVVGSVPRSAGSLRRREHLNELRDGVVAAYRESRGKSHSHDAGCALSSRSK